MNQTIRRDHYLQKLIDRKENGLVKVITGIRRCGKSFLLFNLFYDYLIESGVKEEQIISIALDDDTFIKYRDPEELSKFIRAKIVSKDMYYTPPETAFPAQRPLRPHPSGRTLRAVSRRASALQPEGRNPRAGAPTTRPRRPEAGRNFRLKMFRICSYALLPRQSCPARSFSI